VNVETVTVLGEDVGVDTGVPTVTTGMVTFPGVETG
jgi:pyruvate/2-oxoglutarate/acetoin dehydrogenase E1 component